MLVSVVGNKLGVWQDPNGAWRASVAETDKHTAETHDDADAARSRRFQQLALPHLDAAYNLARWLSGNASDAQDIVQEAFMRAFRFFDSFHGDSARPWLLAIVRRTWYSEWRRRAASHEVAAFEDRFDDEAVDGWSEYAADPQILLMREQDTRLVHEALQQLPVEFREVLILRELEELSYSEIAAIADLPIGTVMSRLTRGRRKLAALLCTGHGPAACATPPQPAGKADSPAPGSNAREMPDGL